MHHSFLPLLCCPATGAPLTLHASEYGANGVVLSGMLSSTFGAQYPIVRGVPRFVSAEHYAGSFGYEWNRWPRLQFEAENIGGPMAGHTARMWDVITAARDEDVRDRTLVEFGCGPGRFLDLVRARGGRAVGVDLSAAVDAARANFRDDPNVLIVQGDLTSPPFRPGSFDGGYSIGVLHHTPNPGLGLHMLARSVRPGGWVACCVYPKDSFYDLPSVSAWRWFTRLCKPYLGYRPALAYSWLSAVVLAPLDPRLDRIPLVRKLWARAKRRLLPVLAIPDRRWRFLDVFDAITPEIASCHTAAEVVEWMTTSGCGEVSATPWCPTSYRGRRSAA